MLTRAPTPVLLIAGQIPRGAMGKGLGAVHEIENQPGAVALRYEVAKTCYEAERGS